MFFLLLLIANFSFANSTEVKEIDGVRIPKGISAKYDKFENAYYITTAAESTNMEGEFINNISLLLIYKTSFVKPYIKIGFETTNNFIDANEISILIEYPDSDFKKYTLEWLQKTIDERIITEGVKKSVLLKIFDLEEFDTKKRISSKLIRQLSKIQDMELFNFLLDNLTQDSVLSLRFKDTVAGTAFDISVREEEKKDLLKIFELSKTLKSGE